VLKGYVLDLFRCLSKKSVGSGVDKTMPLKDVIFLFSWRCNSQCISCKVWEKKAGHEMSLEQIKQMFTKTPCKEAAHVYLTGGEPFLTHKLVDICEIVKNSLNVPISLSTNGLLPENVEQFAGEIKDLGVELTVELSLNGPREVHDYTRGVKGNYDKLMDTRKVLEDLGVPYLWLFTIFKPTVPYIKWFEKFREGELKAYALGLPAERYNNPDQSLFLLDRHDIKIVFEDCRNESLKKYLSLRLREKVFFSPCVMGGPSD